MYIENYMALLSCIISPNEPNADTVIKLLTGMDVSHKSESNYKHKNILITDLITNEKFKFKTQKEANNFLGVKSGTVCKYLKTERIYKNRYFFERVE